MPTSHDPGLLVHRLFELAVNHGDLAIITDLYTADFVDQAPGPGQPPGAAGIIAVVRRYREAIPDLTVTVEEVIACDDRVVTRETWRGTHTGELAGVPPRGARFGVTRMHIFRLVDGRIAEEWTAGNVLDALRTNG